jgi:SAM-dependent methyltransferase
LRARKKLLAQLRHCPDCELLFLWPRTGITDTTFYQDDYSEGTLTDLPSSYELGRLVTARFRGGMLDYSDRVSAVHELCSMGRLLDYGASWGYGVWQFRDAGYDAVGFEVSSRRAAFGREQLDLEIVDNVNDLLSNSFDVIHSSHTLEHVNDLRATFSHFRRLLRLGGHLVVFVPNGGGRSARELGVRWGPLIGEKHVNALTEAFLGSALAVHGFTCTFGGKDADELRLIATLNSSPAAESNS